MRASQADMAMMRVLLAACLFLAGCGGGAPVPASEPPMLKASAPLTFYDGPVEIRVVSYLDDPVLGWSADGPASHGVGVYHVEVSYGGYSVVGDVFCGAPLTWVWVVP